MLRKKDMPLPKCECEMARATIRILVQDIDSGRSIHSKGCCPQCALDGIDHDLMPNTARDVLNALIEN